MKLGLDCLGEGGSSAVRPSCGECISSTVLSESLFMIIFALGFEIQTIARIPILNFKILKHCRF